MRPMSTLHDSMVYKLWLLKFNQMHTKSAYPMSTNVIPLLLLVVVESMLCDKNEYSPLRLYFPVK